MTNIEYTYEIKRVDVNSGTMEVLYSSIDLPDLLVSVRLPFQGQSLEDTIRAAAPITEWEKNIKKYDIPEIGVSGTVSHINPQSVPMPTETVISVANTQATDPLTEAMIQAHIQKVIAQMNDGVL